MLARPQQFWLAESAFIPLPKVAIPGDGRAAQGTGSWRMKSGSIRNAPNHRRLESTLRSRDNYVDKRRGVPRATDSLPNMPDWMGGLYRGGALCFRAVGLLSSPTLG